MTDKNENEVRIGDWIKFKTARRADRDQVYHWDEYLYRQPYHADTVISGYEDELFCFVKSPWVKLYSKDIELVQGDELFLCVLSN